MTTRRRIDTAERRARLVARHGLDGAAAGTVEATRGVVALHSTDPAAPPLGGWARIAGFTTADLDRALYEDRTLWRLHAMRRTLFVVPVDDAPVFDAAAGRDIAARERRRVGQWVAAQRGVTDARRWLAAVQARLLDVLDGGGQWRTQELSAAVPELATKLTVGSGRWTSEVPLASRLLFLLAMEGRVVRARPAGSWRSSQYRWAAASTWFGRTVEPIEPALACAELARRYLGANGPATLTDLAWWTGWTVKQTRDALAACGAVAVDLDEGAEGFVLPGDLDAPEAVPGVATLLPALDATPMAWKQRDWFLGSHGDRLFDRNGNVGPTVWLDGRVVGGWAQRPDGAVVYRLLEDIGTDAAKLVEERAAALTAWMDGIAVIPRFRTPLERELSS